MKSIKQQYIDLTEGKMSQGNFMRNLRMTIPQYVTNVTSFGDAVRILKNKNIISEVLTTEEEVFSQGAQDESVTTTNTTAGYDSVSEENDETSNSDAEFDAMLKQLEDEMAGEIAVKSDKLDEPLEEINEGKEPKAGFYTFFIDGKTGEIKNKGFDYFTEDITTKLTYKDSDVEESTAGKKYGFEKIITINEDTYLIESHSYGITVSTSNSSKDFFTEREYIITKFNNKGQVQWMRVIPKFTVNLNDFNYIVKNNTIYMVYLDHPNNIKDIDINNYKPRKVEKVKNIDEATVVCTSVDDKGNLSRKELFLY
jgi:hypothetical protein